MCMQVDIDLAMSGIDKLLKSQELTFAFVGVAPALAIVYAFGGWARQFVFGGGEGKYGARKIRANVWSEIRRVERLLNASHHDTPQRTTDLRAYEFSLSQSSVSNASLPKQRDLLPPLTTGLIILSLTHLRDYALLHLPVRSRIREGFLEDIKDLENPELGREEKRRVVERMWRCWSVPLGWSKIGK